MIWNAYAILIIEKNYKNDATNFMSGIYGSKLSDNFFSIEFSADGLYPYTHLGASFRINDNLRDSLREFTNNFANSSVRIVEDHELRPLIILQELLIVNSLKIIPPYERTEREQHKLMYYEKATIKNLPEDEIWHLFDNSDDWADHFEGFFALEVEINETLRAEVEKDEPLLAFKVEQAIIEEMNRQKLPIIS